MLRQTQAPDLQQALVQGQNLLLLLIALFLTEHLCGVTSCTGQLWLPSEVWRHAGHVEIPAGASQCWREVGTGGEGWEGERTQLSLQSRYNPEILKKEVIKQREAELKGHFRAATW